MVKKLVLSGPMTGHNGFNFEAFNRAEKALKAVGYEVVNPANKGDGEWIDLIKPCMDSIIEADGVAVLPWESSGVESDMSPGMIVELAVAQRYNKPVKPLEYWIAEPSASTKPGTEMD